VASLRNRILEFTTVQVEGNGVTASASGRVGLDATAPIDAHLVFDADLARTPHPADLTVTGTRTATSRSTERGAARAPSARSPSRGSRPRGPADDRDLETAVSTCKATWPVVQNIRATVGGRRWS
jgi:hypothetical protein